MLVHGRLVKLGGGKWFARPVLVKEGGRLGCRSAEDEGQLRQNRFGQPRLWLR